MKNFIVFWRFVDDEKDNITFTTVHDDSVLDMKKSCRENGFIYLKHFTESYYRAFPEDENELYMALVENAAKSAGEANSKVYLYLKQCRDIIDLCLN